MAGGLVSRGASGEARVLGELLPAVTPSWLIHVFLWGARASPHTAGPCPSGFPNTPAQEVGEGAEGQVPT